MKTVTVTGGNLFRVALDQLGDATQWNRIAQINGLVDPVLVGVVKLKLPVANKSAGGGVYVAAS